MKKLSFLFLGGCCDFKDTCIEAGRKDFDLRKCVEFLNYETFQSLFIFFTCSVGVAICVYIIRKYLKDGDYQYKDGFLLTWVALVPLIVFAIMYFFESFKLLFATSLFF